MGARRLSVRSERTSRPHAAVGDTGGSAPYEHAGFCSSERDQAAADHGLIWFGPGYARTAGSGRVGAKGGDLGGDLHGSVAGIRILQPLLHSRDSAGVFYV